MISNIVGAEHFIPVCRAWNMLSLAEVAIIESWRKSYLDTEIQTAANFPESCAAYLQPLAKKVRASQIDAGRVTGYLRRTPRSIGDAA